ncbi:MAG: hypothetical protein RLZZ129_29 [Verrucomicrobiota bacterium]
MTVPTAVRAAAALELKLRQTEGQRVGILVQHGDGWRYQGQTLTDDEAMALRKSSRWQWVIVTRKPAPLPTQGNS